MSGGWKTTDVGPTKSQPDNWTPTQDWWQELRADEAAAMAETISGPKRRHEGTVERLTPAKRQRNARH